MVVRGSGYDCPRRHPGSKGIAETIGVDDRGAMIVALDGGRTAGLGRVDQCTEVLATFDDALDEMVSALREYTDDWSDHLLHAPNHAELSTDEQLRSWLQQ